MDFKLFLKPTADHATISSLLFFILTLIILPSRVSAQPKIPVYPLKFSYNCFGNDYLHGGINLRTDGNFSLRLTQMQGGETFDAGTWREEGENYLLQFKTFDSTILRDLFLWEANASYPRGAKRPEIVGKNSVRIPSALKYVWLFIVNCQQVKYESK